MCEIAYTAVLELYMLAVIFFLSLSRPLTCLPTCLNRLQSAGSTTVPVVSMQYCVCLCCFVDIITMTDKDADNTSSTTKEVASPPRKGANLTLNLPVDSDYVVAWNQCTVVAISIRIYPCKLRCPR